MLQNPIFLQVIESSHQTRELGCTDHFIERLKFKIVNGCLPLSWRRPCIFGLMFLHLFGYFSSLALWLESNFSSFFSLSQKKSFFLFIFLFWMQLVFQSFIIVWVKMWKEFFISLINFQLFFVFIASYSSAKELQLSDAFLGAFTDI